ncbi:zinc-dependent peptidase [uncultured Cytophaga sp.]|uniref:zinc-dependent peptidase n=1 Tax=uncultured Cytophaga sp. TaxID=160238 RepID=UPI002621AC65|nr:zinc-dependent peptidase [uncultured Cytophaga sp.]
MHEIYNVLLFEFPYFKKINEDRRTLLCNRTKLFIDGTDFIPKKGLKLTNRMIILIAACSQQLTLGFKKHYGYDYFDKIIVYPEKYLSTITQKMHTGEMNTSGIIVLSWEDFYKGMSIDDNAQNVGLHEFAHALEFMDIANKDVDEMYSACLDKFITIGRHYLKNNPGKIFFRNYATTNMSEFLAVATEYYFEKPKEFFQNEPELFEALDDAYQQNILSKNARYSNESTKIKTISGEEIYGNTSSLLNQVGEVIAYLVFNGFAGFITFQMPILGCILLGIGNYGIYHFLIKSSFMLYSDNVKIQQPLARILFNLMFPRIVSLSSVVSYSNVLYVAVQETRNNGLKQQWDFTNWKPDVEYSFSVCYLFEGKLTYAKLSSTCQNLNKVFTFLSVKKKVATRFEGELVKF